MHTVLLDKPTSELRDVSWHMAHSSAHAPTLTPAKQAGTRFTSPGGMEGWVDLGGWLHTKMVYPPEDGHPSKY